MLAINKRLKLVAEYVENRRLADIGSDHAYLPIYLAKNNKIDYAVAGEIVEGPHKVSIKNVQEENLVGTIDCRKAAGLDAIELSDNIEVITICGMGGKLIADILEKGKEKLANKPNLVLQPNVGENFVREKLQELGYEITAENIIEEDGHIYEIIVAKPGVMNLSEDEIKEMLNISSLKLENPEKYIRKNGERARLTRFSQDLFRKMLNISDYYDSDKFEKENTTTANVVNKLIFLRNIMLIYLGINLILCIISLFKNYKNIKNLEKYMEVKEKRIWLLYGLDFLTLFIYCIFTIFTGSEKLIELEKFIFYYIVLKNFLLYYYLKLSKKKFRKLVVINYLVLIFISIFVRNIRINIIFYYLLYFFSLLYLPIKQKLKRIVLVEPLYLITQILYLTIVYLWLYRLI